MHYAASEGKVGAVKLLTELGANVDITNKVSWYTFSCIVSSTAVIIYTHSSYVAIIQWVTNSVTRWCHIIRLVTTPIPIWL